MERYIICKTHTESCPSCNYSGSFFKEGNTMCPACQVFWEWAEHDNSDCEDTNICCVCDKPVRETDALRIKTYDTPWEADDDYEIKVFCSGDCCWGMENYFACESCRRTICMTNPKNAIHIQYRNIGDCFVLCLKCYEENILENGVDKNELEEGKIPGMFFNVGNAEVLNEGYTEEGYYFINHKNKKDFIEKALKYINEGYKIVIAYEDLSIIGNEGYVTLFIKKGEK